MNAEAHEYRAGFVAVVGRPNVGKSTLMNLLLRQKVAITSPKPQTTRVNQFGIHTTETAQFVFVDTPGIHHPAHALGRSMVREANSALVDVDIVLCLVEIHQEPSEEDLLVVERVQKTPNVARVLGLNKVDLAEGRGDPRFITPYLESGQWDEIVAFSAVTGEGIDDLWAALHKHLPEHPPFYDEEEVTTTRERDIAAELIREQVLAHTHDEVPHAVAVVTEEYKDRDNGMLFVSAMIYVERDSQKGIIIGKGGSMLKAIGASSRTAIEALSGRRVFLELRVKVRKDWRKKDPGLRELGYR